MGPEKLLPFPPVHRDTDAYVDALLSFVTESDTLHTLCGNVHVLDFFTQEPDLYSCILPQAWRDWLGSVPISDILDLLMRENVEVWENDGSDGHAEWRGHRMPPITFLEYIRKVRSFCLERTFVAPVDVPPAELSYSIAVGMKPKKAHEVAHFAAFIDSLMSEIKETTPHQITHIVDFGSGQNYLGRVLASPLYQRRIIAVESKQLNIDSAKHMDISAKLAKKISIWRNKKEFRATGFNDPESLQYEFERVYGKSPKHAHESHADEDGNLGMQLGHIRYVEHRIVDGNLQHVLNESEVDSSCEAHKQPALGAMVVSLHSCGNLLHHGLRSLILNPDVKVVCMVGCCYNLMTERLGPSTFKHPSLRSYNQRVEDCGAACDPHGFPMSSRLVNQTYHGRKGVRMNITARMMAVQAPYNWTDADSDSFFTRHFYRALLQKILVDKDVLKATVPSDGAGVPGRQIGTEPLTIGSLRKGCYTSFNAYIRGAIEKIRTMPSYTKKADILMQELTDEDIESYRQRYIDRKHQLSIVWSLMAFSAGVVESLIVTDRWLYLREQEIIDKAWVQTVFDYGQSPRNLVVVGIKK